MKNKYLLPTLTASFLASTIVQAGDPLKGQAISGACTSCHGTYGLSYSDSYPNLAGQKQAFLIKALQQYQTGQRNDPTMQAIAGPLSAQNIENLAAYFAGNSTIPSYSATTQSLHIPIVDVSSTYYQADMQQLSDTTFGLTSLKNIK